MSPTELIGRVDFLNRTTNSEQATESSAAIEVRGFDGFEVAVGGVPVRRWYAGKACNLLQYLLLRQGRVVSRDALFDALWPESSTGGSSSLKVAVHMLRRTLTAAEEKAGVAAAGSTLALRTRGSGYVLDVDNVAIDFQRFDELIDAAHTVQRRSPDLATDYYRQAIALYRGDFLPSVRMDWAEVHREWLRSRALYALERLRAADLAAGDHLAVIDWCRRSIDLEPFCEDAYRTLMTLHGCAGELHQVRRWFTICRTRLREDLGTEPRQATIDAFTEASSGDLTGLDPADPHLRMTA